jgi:hypothetical protein
VKLHRIVVVILHLLDMLRFGEVEVSTVDVPQDVLQPGIPLDVPFDGTGSGVKVKGGLGDESAG